MLPKIIREFENCEELDKEIQALGLTRMVAQKGNAYWATVQKVYDTKIVILAAAGAELGKTSPYIALLEALEHAKERSNEPTN